MVDFNMAQILKQNSCFSDRVRIDLGSAGSILSGYSHSLLFPCLSKNPPISEFASSEIPQLLLFSGKSQPFKYVPHESKSIICSNIVRSNMGAKSLRYLNYCMTDVSGAYSGGRGGQYYLSFEIRAQLI